MGTIVNAIDAALEAEQDDEFRAHLGMSGIGDPCARKIWFDFRWVTKKLHKGQMLRLLNRGKLEEDRFVGWLIKAGVTVHQNDPATGKQYRFTGYKGHVGGEMDGVGVGLIDGPYLLEFKTSNTTAFKEMESNGVCLTKPVHYVQMQMYMGVFNLSRALYLMIEKNTDKIYEEVVFFDKECFEKYSERARMIVDSPEPPPRISNNPSWYECKWCDHHAVCHLKAAPEKNCRTCAHSTPIEQGRWMCENDSKDPPFLSGVIPIALVKTACPGYYQHPLE
jgi:hypothetical protein